MSEKIVLEATLKDKTGKGVSRELRRNGRVPAVIYGNDGKDPVMISVDERELSFHCYKSTFRTTALELKVGKDTYKVLPKALEIHPVTDRVEHVDFYRIGQNSEIKVSVPLKLIGREKSVGVKRGGMLNLVTRRIDVFCSEKQIPKIIELDISSLNIGSRVRLADLKLPNGVKLVAKNTTQTVLTLVGRGKSTEAAAEGAEAAAK